LRAIRWSLAIAISLAAFAATWYTCTSFARLNSGASWAIAGVLFGAALAVLGRWATRETVQGGLEQETAPAPVIRATGHHHTQATTGNNGIIVSGNVHNSTIQVKPLRTTSSRPSRPRARVRPPVLPPSIPGIVSPPGEYPALEFGLRGRLLLTGAGGQSHHIAGTTRSAALDMLNDDRSLITGQDDALPDFMNKWCGNGWRPQKWQLRGEASAREANARWSGHTPGEQRLAEARLTLEVTQDPAQGDSLTVTVHSLLANPCRPNPIELLREWGESLERAGGPGSLRPSGRRAPGPFVHVNDVGLHMLDILYTLWGPLGHILSTRIFSQELGQPAQLDLAAFTIGRGHDQPAINACIDFGTAQLIPGVTPRTRTLFDPIQPDMGLSNSDEMGKIVHDWLIHLCLYNGYEKFESELSVWKKP